MGGFCMTREQYFGNVKVEKGNHYCMFCDSEADFVITKATDWKFEFPICNKCADLFKKKIDTGMILGKDRIFLTNAEQRRCEYMKKKS